MNDDRNLFLVMIGFLSLVSLINFYLVCYNTHNLNQHIEKHEVIKEITVPTVIQIDMSYKQPMDTSIIKIENHKNQ